MASYYTRNTEFYKDEEEDRLSRKQVDRWIFVLLMLVISFVPILIVGSVRDVMSPHITTIEQISSGEKGDIFTHYKSIALIVITIGAVILLFAKIFFMSGEIRKTKLNIFLGVFIVAVIISTLLSPSISIALWGQYNRSDGAISYICYMILFFVAMNIEYSTRRFHYVKYGLYPFVFINFILITMNFTGHDAMTYPFFQKMISIFLPKGASLNEGSIMLGTLNQWNYMSGMFAIMTVMYLAWAIVDSNKIRSSINVVMSVISLSVMLMALSTSGFLTLVIITPLLIVLAIKSLSLKKALIGLAIFLILGVSAFHVLAEKNPRVWDESFGFVIKKNPYTDTVVQTPTIDSGDLDFTFGRHVYAAENTFELPVLPERGYSALSNREYIWNKTINLTLERPLFGFGLDTLMYQFPHYNIDARKGILSEDFIVDKPHNMYIGVLYGTGIVGFIGFAGLAIITIISALKAIIVREYRIAAIFGLAWLAFLTQALVNDSLPATSGPMWTIAGMMMAILLTNKDVEENTDGRND
ncbi:O-antigen ligase family protein [Paenisporosarcina quisquiliarum]|uniref:O-antigen ligase family protein n=1 Tax=Paenisporosarcina quisquiliarum TaxID=365346 RepID=UPI0037370A9D